MALMTNQVSFAYKSYNNSYFDANDIVFYDPTKGGDEAADCTGEASATIDASTIPASSFTFLDGVNINDKVAKNKYRYTPASAATGVPWQALAAIHYRENSDMLTTTSLSNGTDLPTDGGTIINVDGQPVPSSAIADAENAAKHLKEMALNKYGIDITKPNLSIADWGNAFLAYNRGEYYKINGKDYTWTPYVMNGFDDATYKYQMKWRESTAADELPKGTTDPKEWARQTGFDGNMGALVVMAYLGGASGSATTSSCLPAGEINLDKVSVASSIIANSNITLFDDPVEHNGPAENLGNIANKSSTGAETSGAVNIYILNIIAALGTSHKISVSSINRYGEDNAGMSHPSGSAVDICVVDGIVFTGENSEWDANEKSVASIVLSIAAPYLVQANEAGKANGSTAKSAIGQAASGTDQVNCGADSILPNELKNDAIGLYKDTCHHMHISVPIGADPSLIGF